jgi:transposase InsO family protein
MSNKYDKDQISEIIEKIKHHKMSYVEGAKHFNIPVRHIYRYNNEQKPTDAPASKEQNQGQDSDVVATTADNEKKPELRVSSLPSELQSIIIDYRKDHPDHGYRRISDYLQDHYFIKVPVKQIRSLLKSHSLEAILDSSYDKEKKGVRRFEACCARELYQMDVSYVYIESCPVFYLTLIIDDHSRFCVGYELTTDQKGLTMINALHRSIEKYGKPQQLLTDQGRSFYSWSFEETLFQKYLRDMKIEHIVSEPHSPQTQGKVERMTQTIQKELLYKVRFKNYEHANSELEAYIHRYNYSRPHQGIEAMCPSDRFHSISDETNKAEQSLLSPNIDLSKGYLILKDSHRTLSVVFCEKALQVFLDGVLLK